VAIALYIDEHVHRAISLGLRLRGVDVLTVQEDGLTATPDSLLLDRALKLQRVMFSQDQDFLVEAHHRQVANIPFAGVIYARQLVAVGNCIHDLEIIAKASDPQDLANRVEYIPSKASTQLS
jgi:predicted nuclease of predicted toxin-antitoxin system